MKEIEKLAYEYSKIADGGWRNEPKQFIHQRGFEAGFRKAREMALAQVRFEPYAPPEMNCLENRIAYLGESEFRDSIIDVESSVASPPNKA